MGISSALLVVTLLAEVAGVSPVGTKAPVESSDDKVICKRMPITGSLASSAKVCRTQHEWTITRETAQAEGRRLLSTRMPDGN